MNTFSYTCRDQSGAIRRGTLQAVDRSAVLSQLTKQGYIPISVVQGVVKEGVKRTKLNVSYLMVVLTGVAVLVLMSVFFIQGLISNKKSNTQAESTQENLNVISAPKSVSLSREAVSISNRAMVAKVAQVVLHKVPVTEKIENIQTNVNPQVRPTQSASEQTNNLAEEVTDSTLNTQTEQLLSMALSEPPGSLVPPLPISENMDADFKQSMSNTIVIRDTDSALEADRKEKIAYLKLDVNAMVKEGYAPADVLKAIEQQHNDIANRRTQLQDEMVALLRENREVEARTLKEEADKELSQVGAEPLKIPKKWQK